jgi:anti-sigma factor RsiW
MTAAALTCREFVELVTGYLEGVLPPEDKIRFEAHMAVCPGCHTYLHQMEQTIGWTGKLTEENISEDAKETLLTAFREWKSGQHPKIADHP